MTFKFNDYVETPVHMNLPLFDKLESLTQDSDHIIIVENELNIFNEYNQIRSLLNSNNKISVIVHCRDQAMPHKDIFNKIDQVFYDLDYHKNYNFVLISAFPYHWNIDFSKNKRFLYVYYPEYNGIYWDIYKDVKPLSSRKLNKHFLCLNKRAEFLRLLLYYEFYNKGWLDKSYFSYLGENYLGGELFCKESHNYYKNEISKFNQYKHLKIPSQSFIQINQDQLLNKYQKKFDTVNCIDPTWKVEYNLYEKSFCSVIVETGPTHKIVNVSEKTFRCIAIQHPAIIFSSNGTNKFLKDLKLDYNLYHKIFQEWDSNSQDFERFDKFVKFIEKISNLNLENLNLLNEVIQDRLVATRKNYINLYHSMLSKQDKLFEKIQKFVLD